MHPEHWIRLVLSLVLGCARLEAGVWVQGPPGKAGAVNQYVEGEGRERRRQPGRVGVGGDLLQSLCTRTTIPSTDLCLVSR